MRIFIVGLDGDGMIGANLMNRGHSWGNFAGGHVDGRLADHIIAEGTTAASSIPTTTITSLIGH